MTRRSHIRETQGRKTEEMVLDSAAPHGWLWGWGCQETITPWPRSTWQSEDMSSSPVGICCLSQVREEARLGDGALSCHGGDPAGRLCRPNSPKHHHGEGRVSQDSGAKLFPPQLSLLQAREPAGLSDWEALPLPTASCWAAGWKQSWEARAGKG